ncbi:MAG: hypothetical protein SPK00_05210 [Corynebacterium glucuronolyticum]|nr:hypothetical protein [Corynebacterium glucuronolyticum]MDD7586281.1 hypothetical protein [Mycobacteriaceae bacterium]MDY5834131.1 hypothetical protein [Corynebacterium glucuronolyticum]
MATIRTRSGRIRRGISIATAAFSLAVVSPIIQPVVAPQVVAVAQAETTLAAEESAAIKAGAVDADAIASGKVTKASQLSYAFD